MKWPPEIAIDLQELIVGCRIAAAKQSKDLQQMNDLASWSTRCCREPIGSVA